MSMIHNGGRFHEYEYAKLALFMILNIFMNKSDEISYLHIILGSESGYESFFTMMCAEKIKVEQQQQPETAKVAGDELAKQSWCVDSGTSTTNAPF